MRAPRKIRYEIALTSKSIDRSSTVPTRPVLDSDREALAQLMLDAYVGTIDYEGESIVEARTEVDDWMNGPSMKEHSFVVGIDDHLVSAVLLMIVDDEPFIAIVMTHPEHKAMGFGRAVTNRALSSLAEQGHKRVVFYITEGNTPSERMFASLGAVPVPSVASD